jgi:hypothetical protein
MIHEFATDTWALINYFSDFVAKEFCRAIGLFFK